MSKIIMNADGKNTKIKINTPPGAKVETNADKIIMKGVQEKSSGGTISHNAKNKLEQADNTMSATNKGKIVNKSMGDLHQTNNIMTAENKGEIQNIAQRKNVGRFIAIIGAIAAIITIIWFIVDISGLL